MHHAPLLAFAVAVLAAAPDEGQWLPSQVRAMDWEKLRARGMEIDKDTFWHPERGGILNAAVELGGCSASFVSARGLLITNHHCGHSAISAASSVRKNYIREGFGARSPQQELRTDLVVQVVRRIEDVTERIHAAQARAATALARYRATQAEIGRIIEAAERDPDTGKKDPRTTCNVASQFEGREYLLYYRTKLPDVRLVYCPPADTASFGGDVDNWEWPRHSGDFAIFRAYVGPDGTPQTYARQNVPFVPDHWLKVAPGGVGEGDLVLIMGYPGDTSRYLSSVAVSDRLSYYYPIRGEILRQMVTELRRVVGDDERSSLELGSTIRRFANIEKNHAGMVAGLVRNAVVDRKINEEEGFERWVRAEPARAEKYGNALDQITELDHQLRLTQEKDLILSLVFDRHVRRVIPLLDRMLTLVESAASNGGSHGRDTVVKLAANPSLRLQQVQNKLLGLLLDHVRTLPDDQRITGAEVLADSEFTADEMIQILLSHSMMVEGERRVELLEAGAEAVRKSSDPLVVLMRGLVDEHAAMIERQHRIDGQRLTVGRRWIEAQQAWRGKRFYPDANRTLRVSIATVKGYSPKDAVTYGPFTTVGGMREKHTDRHPFSMPELLQEAARRRWLSAYRHKDLGDVPVCFLSDGDTTNGNSGSPVINGKGQLVGLNFDRVFENVSCDYGWNAERSRNISLDIRFVLWHLESVQPAPHLLRELGL